MNPYDIERIFAEIEADIIEALIRQFRKDRPDGDPGGYEWKDWRIRQINAIRGFIRGIRGRFSRRYRRLNERVKSLLGAVFDAHIAEAIDAQAARTGQGEFFNINRTRIEALEAATVNDLAEAEAAVFRKTEDAYRQIIYKAQIALNSGMVTYAQAVDMATRDFLAAGINCIVYKNGARHTVQDYARMCLRTAIERAALMAEGEIRTQTGIHTVYATWRAQACPKCIRFLGRLMVDDVYSEGTRAEAEALDCITLSDAMRQGFLHPNCKDTVLTYDPNRWRNDPANDPLKKTATKRALHEATLRQQAGQRVEAAKLTEQKYRRIADGQLDDQNRQAYEARAEEWKNRREAAEKEWREIPMPKPGNPVAGAEKATEPLRKPEPIHAADVAAAMLFSDLLEDVAEEAKKKKQKQTK